MFWIQMILFQAVATLRVEVEPSRALFKAGDRRELHCRVSGCSAPASFSWAVLEDKPLTASIHSEGAESVVIFDPVTSDHEVALLCKVRCGVMSGQSRATLQVYSFPSAPVISGHHHLLLGEERNLSCQVSNLHPPQLLSVQWLQAGQVLQSPVADLGPSSASSTISVTPTRNSSTHSITCRAELHLSALPLELRVREATVPLRPQYAPQITEISPPALVHSGSSLSLFCSADGSPPPSISWTLIRPSGQPLAVGQNRSLVLDSVSARQAGLYHCRASNPLGNQTAAVRVTVQAPPNNTSISASPAVELLEGQSLNISCWSEGPGLRLVLRRLSQEQELWDKEIQDQELQDQEIQDQEWKSSFSSFISISRSPVGLEDSGQYQCQSSNRFGSELVSISVIVKVPPRNTSILVLPSSQVEEGQNVTVHCSSRSFPPAVVVLRKLSNGTEQHSADGVFQLVHVSANDTGSYQVTISNELGSQTHVFTINVTEKRSSKSHVWTFSLVAVVLSIAALDILRRRRKKGSYQLA